MSAPQAPSVAQTQLVIDWLTSLGWDTAQETGWPLLPGPLILDEPDKSVWVTVTGGPGYTTEEAATDAWSFQARVRGPADDPYTPELAALQLDQLILTAPFPVRVDGMAVQHAHRAAGPPSALPVDPGDLRHEFTATYLIVTGA